MLLTETHIIKKGHRFYDECNSLCRLSKILYDSCLNIARQDYFLDNKYMGLKKLYHTTKSLDLWEEINLPRKVCNEVIMLVDQNFRSFIGSLKNYKPSSHKINIPDHNQGDKQVVLYQKGAVNQARYQVDGKIRLSQTGIYIKIHSCKIEEIRQVRIVPKDSYFVIEIVYKKECSKQKTDGITASIDLGINNLATVAFSDGKNPFIINGRPLKSINQFYNKKKAYFQSKLKEKMRTTNNMEKLTNKRNSKVNDFMHKSSRLLADELSSRNVSTLVIGYNISWKQEINIGKRNNQSFMNIPHLKFTELIKYKCELEGIKVVIQEESYTSKCSFLDLEEVKKHEIYQGKRIKRGLFRAADKRIINADLNGAYNIMRKAIPDVFTYKGIEDVAVHPRHLCLN